MMANDSNINNKTGCCTSQMAKEHTGHLVERQDNKRGGQNQNWTTNHGQHTERKTTSMAWACFPSGPPAYIAQQALYWQVAGYKRGPGRPRANWRSTVNQDLDKRWDSAGRKQRWQLLTDTDGVAECGPMCPVGCRRIKVKVKVKV